MIATCNHVGRHKSQWLIQSVLNEYGLGKIKFLSLVLGVCQSKYNTSLLILIIDTLTEYIFSRLTNYYMYTVFMLFHCDQPLDHFYLIWS